MEIVEAVILLVLFVVISNIISHYLVAIPVSLIQIAIGLLIALIFDFEIPLNTSWFMLLFIAPLLFNDGHHFPKRELWALRGPIVANAILLVFIATFLGGLLIHWLIPDMPLSASFALSAILSPTDPIAVQSISARAKLPANVLHLVSGESLINDASGLIGFKYGLAATLTGVFSLTQAVGDFFYISIVGAIVGLVMMLSFHFLKGFFLRQGINDVVLHTILQISTPFLIYLVSEEVFHASGVIAVVAAGIFSTNQRNLYSDYYLAELNIVSDKTWDILVYLLNGIVFLILGIELPVAFGDVVKNPTVNTKSAILYVFVTWLGLFIIRTLWTYGYSFLSYLRDKNGKEQPKFKVAVISGLTGVRGAITMAGVLSVPVLLDNGKAFPERPLMLFVAAGVILLSLLSAIIFLPLFVPNGKPLRLRGSLPSDDEDVDETAADEDAVADAATAKYTLTQAQLYMYQVALHKIISEKHEDNSRAALDLAGEYQVMIRRVELDLNDDNSLPPMLADELILNRVGLEGELKTLDELWKANQIQVETYRYYEENIAQRRKNFENIGKSEWRVRYQLAFFRFRNRFNHLKAELTLQKNSDRPFFNERLFAERQMAKGGLKHLSAYLRKPENRQKNYNRQAIYQLVTRYRRRVANLKSIGNQRSEIYEHQLDLLRTHALASQRSAIQEMVENGLITNNMAAKLRQQINYMENAMVMTTDQDVDMT
ncbi:NhaP-type Na H and K H antiporter [Agrilactobacillus composti DSM 18527 = JCM 14202]|uniref:NhaP-type Na H and K H antiporter n=1 Tax=Agrilactobacillus composti DSM 18527 = JCM 14202 TaxID=1423734 RepID=X0PF19_9LACO|nr:sodium:proton antiporter [Agrilactobacillus composti]KRM35163.1 NhaP-type Na H and K H antiporter [Agrilactobacillus composti DSM 18527 = JCM 14202]GAF40208.1 Na+/H+ antiporter [Agrilactobacillus composti DSM 18527 = JCM 14202]